jgi:hypothetical protein
MTTIAHTLGALFLSRSAEGTTRRGADNRRFEPAPPRSRPACLRFGVISALSLLAICAHIEGTCAQDFYKDKRITVVVGAGAGANYDLYGRLLAENLKKYIPGHPTVIVENRPGAASRVAMNYVYRQAPQDGTVIGMAVNLLPFDQFVFPEAARQYDITKFQWIGSMASLNGVIAVWHTSPVKTLEGAMQSSIVLGAVGRPSESFVVPAVLNEVMGTRFRIVPGYPSVSDISFAMEKGEIAGHGGSWSSLRVSQPDWIRERKVIPIIQVGQTKDPTMSPDVPLLNALAKSDEQRAVYGLLTSATHFARPFAVGPNVPADRVAILRRAFSELMKDQEFIKLAESRHFDISPVSGEDMSEAIGRLKQSITPEYAARIRRALQQ